MQEMSGRFDIQDLLAGYCYAVVTCDFGLLDSIFATDAIIDSAEMVGVKGSLAR